MTTHRRSILVVLVVFACWSSGAHAAGKPPTSEFPQRPIRLVVPFPPGGSNDVLARYLAAKLGDQLREQVVIDNRGGANGIIGADLVAHASPDGYTLLMVSTSYVMNAAVRPLPYDVEKSFDPVSTIGSSPNSIVVHPGFVSSLRELVDRARAQPGSIFYAATGVGGFNHFGGELFNKVAGIKLTMVPYKGGGPAMVDVMSGQVPMMFSRLPRFCPTCVPASSTCSQSELRNVPRRCLTFLPLRKRVFPAMKSMFGGVSSRRPECRAQCWINCGASSVRCSRSPRRGAAWLPTLPNRWR